MRRSRAGAGGVAAAAVASSLVAALLAVVAGLTTLTVTPRPWHWFTPAVWSATGVLSLLSVVLARYSALSGAAARVSGGDVADAADLLADAVREFWSREAALREVTAPRPLAVRWSSARRPAAGRDVVTGEDGTTWTARPASGGIRDITAGFSLRPTGRDAAAGEHDPARGQLVVLGEAGAGKTALAMLLVLGLLRHRASGELVPVLLPVSSWDPTRRIRAPSSPGCSARRTRS